MKLLRRERDSTEGRKRRSERAMSCLSGFTRPVLSEAAGQMALD